MTDPRNIAHDKRVRQEKKHRHEEIARGADQAVQPGKKPHMAPGAQEHAPDPDPGPSPTERSPGTP